MHDILPAPARAPLDLLWRIFASWPIFTFSLWRSTMMLDERWKNALVITAIVLAGLFVVAQAIKLWAKSICECCGN